MRESSNGSSSELEAVKSEIDRIGQDLQESLAAAESEDVNGGSEDRLATWKKRLADAEDSLTRAEAITQQLRSNQNQLDAKLAKLEDTERAIFLVGMAIIFVPLLFFTLGSSAVWLPPEHLSMTDGSSSVGYTLDSNSEWHSVLLEEDRRVMHFSSDRILERTLCSLHNRTATRSLADFLSGQERADPYPSCDSIDG